MIIHSPTASDADWKGVVWSGSNVDSDWKGVVWWGLSVGSGDGLGFVALLIVTEWTKKKD